MPLLIIQPNYTTGEAESWLLHLMADVLELVFPGDADDLFYKIEHGLEHKDIDDIFERAIKRLLK